MLVGFLCDDLCEVGRREAAALRRESPVFSGFTSAIWGMCCANLGQIKVCCELCCLQEKENQSKNSVRPLGFSRFPHKKEFHEANNEV